MTIPRQSDPRWAALITGDHEPNLSALSTKLVLQRLRTAVKQDPARLSLAVAELYAFFAANSFAQRDLAAL